MQKKPIHIKKEYVNKYKELLIKFNSYRSQEKLKKFKKSYWQGERDMVYYISCHEGGGGYLEKNKKYFQKRYWQSREYVI